MEARKEMNSRLMGTFMALNVLDAALTQALVATGHYHEGNVWVPESLGGMLAFKIVVPAVLVAGVAIASKPPYMVANNVLKGLTIGQALVVGWNAFNLAFVAPESAVV